MPRVSDFGSDVPNDYFLGNYLCSFWIIILCAPFLAVTEVRWGRGSREQSRHLRSEWTSSILSSAAHSAITAVASSVTCKYVEILHSMHSFTKLCSYPL